eukprot:TRINITY_DN2989_c0_g1_i3.p2 TRINITY_DN2989_c0_g1~~TRINITY_DN2989_c0_g1_i3.p2  ORF type:complete len:226 (-),score=39.23 TRINITY_DN2989_c0_g1_i3:99-776(-)
MARLLSAKTVGMALIPLVLFISVAMATFDDDEYVLTVVRSPKLEEAHAQLLQIMDLGVSGIEVGKDFFELYVDYDLMEKIAKNGVEFTPAVNPSQEIHRKEKARKAEERQSSTWNVNTYHHYDDLVAFLNDMHTQYPSFTQKFSIGKSVQGRDILGLRISKNIGKNENEPEFKYIGNMHGDETVGREMLVQLIYLFCTEYQGNGPYSDRITRLIEGSATYIQWRG